MGGVVQPADGQPRVDRIGGGDHLFAQTMLSLSFKIDDWVDGFADQLKSIGVGAVKTTGSVIKSTLTAPKTFIDWFNKSGDEPNTEEPQKTKGP